MDRKRGSLCSIQSLPEETVCSILNIVLEDIVEHDMMTTPEVENQVLAGGLPFPHNMALVCRRWRDIVSNTPELQARVFWIVPVPEAEGPRICSQLEESCYSFHLTIINSWNHERGIRHILHHIAPYLQRLRSLRMANFYEAYDQPHLDTLTGYAPQLESLRLTDGKHIHHCTDFKSRLKLDCPALRIFHVDKIVACNLDHQWLKNNLKHVQFITISCGSARHDPLTYSVQAVALSRALDAVPREKIPCLTLDNLRLPSSSLAYMNEVGVKIGAKQVILRKSISALAAIDDNCETIVIRQCDSIHDLQSISLPCSSKSLELDGCDGKESWWIPNPRTWDGDTVTIINGNSPCIEMILHLLGAPFKGHGCSLPWHRVTTLKLVVNGNLPLTLLKAMISSRQEAAGQEKLSGESDGELEFEGVRPLVVLHVHGGQPLLRKESAWFKKRVRDFVWDYKKGWRSTRAATLRSSTSHVSKSK